VIGDCFEFKSFEFNFLKKCFNLMKKVLKWFTTNLLGFYCN